MSFLVYRDRVVYRRSARLVLAVEGRSLYHPRVTGMRTLAAELHYRGFLCTYALANGRLVIREIWAGITYDLAQQLPEGGTYRLLGRNATVRHLGKWTQGPNGEWLRPFGDTRFQFGADAPNWPFTGRMLLGCRAMRTRPWIDWSYCGAPMHLVPSWRELVMLTFRRGMLISAVDMSDAAREARVRYRKFDRLDWGTQRDAFVAAFHGCETGIMDAFGSGMDFDYTRHMARHALPKWPGQADGASSV